MKLLTICAINFFLSVCLFGQVENPAIWSYKASKLEAKKGETIDLIFTASIKSGWYMYSVGQFEMAPSTTFTFEKNNTYDLVGKVKATKAKHKIDQYIGEYDYFTEKAQFIQKIKILSENPVIKGTYEYSTCSNETGVCLPPKDAEFIFTGFIIKGKVPEEIKKKQKSEIKINSEEIKAEDSNEVVKSIVDTAQKKVAPISAAASQPDTINEEEGLGAFFILAFLSGLLALLTPCVFPMIPMTVTFFLNSGKSKLDGIIKALVYGLSIIIIYVFIGSLVAKLAGPEAANFLSTHWLPNLFFFGVFIFFALSFLGLFEIVLPSSLVNAADRQSEKGGYAGIFFMAFTLVLVSFSCTGPIVGTILVQSAGGAFLKPVIGMLGFSLAFAIPFTLFAIFPSWLKNLPKSGGWLNSVKVTLGFLELALAFKFLSLADQAYHWGILDRDINITLWIAIFGTLSLYLLGFITLPHDDKHEKTGVLRLITGILALSFTIYLIPGLFGAPLKPLSGYLPPLTTLDFNLSENKYANINETGNISEIPKYNDFLKLPHNIQGYFDYKQAIESAKKLHKPVFIDFTGHGCVNCREMEANVWAEPEVLKRLKKDFVVVALYVDDKMELPESEWYTSTYDNKIKKTIGKQNADFQINRYNTNAQPYYLVVDNEGNTLSGPVAYDLNPDNFIKFLDAGSSAYASAKKP